MLPSALRMEAVFSSETMAHNQILYSATTQKIVIYIARHFFVACGQGHIL
jgi:hypothetical protein